MNCARAGVENQNGCEIRTTSGTQNHHVLPPSSSHHISVLKKNENKVTEKGKKEKKHGATEKVKREVGTKCLTKCRGKWKAEQSVACSIIKTVASDIAKPSRGCGHQWIYPLLPFCVISCILYNEMVAPEHF